MWPFGKMDKDKAQCELEKLERRKLELLHIIFSSSIDSIEDGDIFKSTIDESVFHVQINQYGYVNFLIYNGYYQQPVLEKPLQRGPAIEWLIRSRCYKVSA